MSDPAHDVDAAFARGIRVKAAPAPEVISCTSQDIDELLLQSALAMTEAQLQVERARANTLQKQLEAET